MGYEYSMVTFGENVLACLAEDHFRRQQEEGCAEVLTFVKDGTPAAGMPAEQIS